MSAVVRTARLSIDDTNAKKAATLEGASDGATVGNGASVERRFLLHVVQTALPLRDFHAEVRAMADVEHLFRSMVVSGGSVRAAAASR